VSVTIEKKTWKVEIKNGKTVYLLRGRISLDTDSAIAQDQIIVQETPTGLINGINPTFTISKSMVPATLEVKRNGLTTHKSEVTITSPTQFTLEESPGIGDTVEVNYIAINI